MKTMHLAALLVFVSGVALAQTPAKTTPAKPVQAMPSATVVQPVSGEPESTTANFGDWTLRCIRAAATPQRMKLCEVTQTITVQGQTSPMAEIAFGHLEADGPLKLTAVLPNNITLPSGVHLAVDEKDQQAADLSWRRCLPGGCYADADVKSDQLSRWRGQTEKGVLQFKDGTGRDFSVPFSFRGLSQALDALDKS